MTSKYLDILRNWYRAAGYNLWIVAGIVLLGVVLGLLNNLRVYEEQRVEIFGDVPTAATADTTESDADASEAGEP